MRPEPLVMTTKFTITRMVKTMMPITKLPLMTKRPNASMTWPAAAGPSWPCDKISRVEARLRESRSMVAINSTVGNAENSSGAWMNSDVIRISTENVMEMASAKSSSSAGSGRMSTTRMAIMPMARPMSLRRSKEPRSESRVSVNDRSPRSAEVVSVMPVVCARWLRSRVPKLCAAGMVPPARKEGKGAALASKIAPKVRWKRTYPPAKCAGFMVTGELIFRPVWEEFRDGPGSGEGWRWLLSAFARGEQ